MERIKSLFNDKVYGFFLRGFLSGLCIVLFDCYQDWRDEILSHDRTITRHDAELLDIKLRLQRLEDKRK